MKIGTLRAALVLSCAALAMAVGFVDTANAQNYLINKTPGFAIRALDLHSSLGVDDTLDTATETLNLWNLNPTTTGVIGNYNIEAYQTDTEASINYAGAGDFGGSIALTTIGSGTIPATGANDISVLANAFLAIPVGSWSIAIASDDGRYMSFIDTAGGVVGFSGFTARGDNITTTGIFTATTTLGFDGTTGHNQSAGTFTVAGGNAEVGTDLALISLSGFYFERTTGGGSFEISIRPGLDSTWDNLGEGWQLLSDNTYGWHVSTTPITLTVVSSLGDRTWDGSVGNWTETDATAWDTGVPPPSGVNSLDFPTFSQVTGQGHNAFVPSGTVSVTGSQGALSLDIAATAGAGGTVIVGAGNSLHSQLNLAIGPTGTLTIGGSVSTFTIATDNAGIINLNGGTLITRAVTAGTLGDVNVTGVSTLNNLGALTADTLTMNASTLTKLGGGALTVNNATTISGGVTFNNNDGSTISLNGQVAGSGGMTKSGNTGTVTFNNAANNNNYTGITSIVGGILTVTRSADLGATGAGNHTAVTGTGQLRLSGTVTTAEVVNFEGNGPASNGAIYVQNAGTKTLSGLVSTTNNANIRVDSGASSQLHLTGGLDIGTGHTLTVTRVGTGEVFQIGAAITGSGAWSMDGDGVTNIRANSPSYSGAITVANGILDLGNFATGLGTTAAGQGTTVNSGATLRLRDGVNTLENVSISGNGEGNIGAIRSENNSNQLGGTVTMTGDSRIHVNATQLTLNGIFNETGGARRLEKTGAGTLILNNAGNNFTGRTIVSHGTLQANTAASLNSTSDVHLVRGAAVAPTSLQINGGGTFFKPITINGTVATLGNGTAATTTTMSGPINLVPNAALNLNGAGDMLMSSSFGNGSAPINYANSLSHYGYHVNNDAATLDLNLNAGMMGGGNPASFANFNGLSFLTVGPSGRGLDFDDDNDYINTGSIGIADNYSNLWVGILTADVTGLWGFRNNGDDDSAGVWFDTNQNGVFNSSVAGLGDNRGEQLSWENTGNDQVNLTAGQQYMVAFTHREGTGGSASDFRFTRPAGTELVINPSSAAQAGLWKSFAVTPSNDVTKTGIGTATLSGNNTYNGTTTIQQGALIAAHSNALGFADGTAASGTKIANGATLGVGGPNASGSVNIGNEHLTLAPTATIRNMGGVNSIASATIVPDPRVAAVAGNSMTIQSGVAGDRLTIGTAGGSMNLGFSALTHAGAGETTILSAISAQGVGTTAIIPDANGLQARRFTGSPGTAALNFSTPGAYTFNGTNGVITQASGLLSLVASATGLQTSIMNFDESASIANNPNVGPIHWQTVLGATAAGDLSNFQVAWTGEFAANLTGVFTFRTHDQNFTGDPDDDASFYIDANQDGVFQSTEGFNSGTAGSVAPTLTAGQKYRIAMSFLEVGGGDSVSYSFQAPGGSITGINPGAVTQNGMFTHPEVTSAPTTYHLVKNDTGILRLNGNNTYNGNTDLNAGTLIINGVTTGQGSYEVASGSTLGGDGTIGLKAGSSIIVAATPGIISPGDAGPGYAGSFGPTFSQGTDAATVGTLSVDQPFGGTAVNLDGILQIDVVDPLTYDILEAINGQIDLDETTSMLSINGRNGQAGNEFELIDFSAMGFLPGDLIDILKATDGVLGKFANMPGASFLDASGDVLVTIDKDFDSVFISFEAAVPEPSTIALWTMLGVVGVAFAWRQRGRLRR